MSDTATLQQRFTGALMGNYGIPPVALSHGQGCRVWDADGREYLDLIAGIAVSSLGHAHPALVDVVTKQVATLAHTSNLFLHEPEVDLAERLLGLLGADGRVFFCNSGTEANEAALKLVRRAAGPGRPVIVAAENGFHGRTMGSLALTGKASIREPFAPFGVEVRFVPFGDAGALAAATRADCAAVFLEPCQGEAGVVPAPDGYLRAARDACDAAGALLVTDEIQSGIGRSGTWFAHQADGVLPDVLTLAKGLGGGLPIGACIGLGAAATALRKGDHGSTFGGNPVACAAALAVLDTIETEGLLARAAATGDKLAAGIGAISHPLLAGVRGRGLWLAAVLTGPVAGAVEAAARDAGFLVNVVQPDAIRLAPPLILSAGEADQFLAAVPGILAAAADAAGQAGAAAAPAAGPAPAAGAAPAAGPAPAGAGPAGRGAG
ncbi:MAG: acetylornithine transaminase, partial [Nocardiopsaceae bacterium]|nr:acetylornithine transaminase [Nocardiopsaceae bacterium]